MSTMGDFTNAENADMHFIYCRTNVMAERRYECITCYILIDDCLVTEFFHRLHRPLRETRSFHVTRHNADRRRTVRSSSPKESILNFVAD
ncbi:hypothetical protein TNCV_3530121 [Trichonephila clavipes]|uniref:Uncharacterized protein n=1 Tax=Trichonephila clavipes TaxID=2585209 RepID=A0A8X6UXU1_TRICX|nr:hypothetical protein TNCV_3530121 [Trichonephila clavipes]